MGTTKTISLSNKHGVEDKKDIIIFAQDRSRSDIPPIIPKINSLKKGQDPYPEDISHFGYDIYLFQVGWTDSGGIKRATNIIEVNKETTSFQLIGCSWKIVADNYEYVQSTAAAISQG